MVLRRARTDAPRWTGVVVAVCAVACAAGIAVFAWAGVAPRATDTQRWFDTRPAFAVVLFGTALVAWVVVGTHRRFRRVPRPVGEGVALAAAVAWACGLALTLDDQAPGWAGVFVGGPLIGVLVATAWSGRPLLMAPALAGAWLVVGPIVAYHLIHFWLAPPTHADLCTQGGMDCFGHGSEADDAGLLGAVCLLFSAVVAALQTAAWL
ncbi:MAG: hypothetical protein REI11_11120, partial [Patulibacter sp.]|nr:hypothetical protein [Patulibacter sp.]